VYGVAEAPTSDLRIVNMDRHLISKLAVEVIKKLVLRFAGDGRKGGLLAVFSGVNANIESLSDQLMKFILSGYRLDLLFSETASETYKKTVVRALDGFPNVRILKDSEIYAALNTAEAVIAPVVGIDTLSQLSLLVADTPHSQLLLNAITMGKPVIIALDDVLSNTKLMSCGLTEALDTRLKTIESYGAITCALTEMGTLVDSQIILHRKSSDLVTLDNKQWGTTHDVQAGKPCRYITDKVLTASHVNSAFLEGFDLRHGPDVIVTPMARDLARQKFVDLSVKSSNFLLE